MASALEQLKQFTTVAVDTGDIKCMLRSLTDVPLVTIICISLH